MWLWKYLVYLVRFSTDTSLGVFALSRRRQKLYGIGGSLLGHLFAAAPRGLLARVTPPCSFFAAYKPFVLF